jgi:uncharacterized membrane protein
MPIINLEFNVDKPLAEVWQFGLDSKRIPEWQYDISAVKNTTGPIAGVGQAYTLVYRMWGRDFDSPVQITRFEPAQTIETSGKIPIGGFFHSTTHMQAVGAGNYIEWQMEYQLPLGFIGKFLDFLIFQKAFENTVSKYNDNFKAVIEGKQPPHQTVSGKLKESHPV